MYSEVSMLAVSMIFELFSRCGIVVFHFITGTKLKEKQI